MGRYEKVLNMLMDYDESIRLAIISNTSGDILWHSKRNDAKLKSQLLKQKKRLNVNQMIG